MNNIETEKAKKFKLYKILMYCIYILALLIIFVFSHDTSMTIFFGIFVSVFFYLTYNFVYHLIVLEPIKITTEKNNIEKAVRLLEESINKSKKTFFAVTGSGRRDLWNNKEVIDALIIAKKERKVIIKIVTGPLEGTTEDMEGGKKVIRIDNKLKELKDKGIIQLTILDTAPNQHYRIVDNLYVIAEDMDYHDNKNDTNEFSRQYKIYQNNFYVANKYEKNFNKLSIKEYKTLFN